MKIKLDKGAYEPTRAFCTDAGLDLKASHDGTVKAGGTATFGTGVRVELPKGTAGVLLPRSGLMTKRDILTFGVVDETYRGEVKVHVFNFGAEDYHIDAGQKITQMLVLNVRYEPVEVVDTLSEGDRGEAGFGSTGV